MSSARITTTFGRLAVTFAVTEFPAAARLMRSSRRFIIDLATYITPKCLQLNVATTRAATLQPVQMYIHSGIWERSGLQVGPVLRFWRSGRRLTDGQRRGAAFSCDLRRLRQSLSFRFRVHANRPVARLLLVLRSGQHVSDRRNPPIGPDTL